MRRLQMGSLVAAMLWMAAGISPVLAEEEAMEPLTWVNFVKTNPGGGPTLEKLVAKYDKPLLDDLVADGTALSWGLGRQMVGPGDVDYLLWVTAADWAAMGAIEAAFETSRRSMSKDEMMEMMEGFVEALDWDAESTTILRHPVFRVEGEAPPKYLRISAYRAVPGRADEVKSLYKAYVVPVHEKLLESHALHGYGLAVQEVHTDASWTHLSWITFTELGNLDGVHKAFAAAESESTKGEGVALEAALHSYFEPGSHFDQLLRIVSFEDE